MYATVIACTYDPFEGQAGTSRDREELQENGGAKRGACGGT